MKKVETNLLFRASDDGGKWTGTDFYAKCSDKGPTIILIKVKDNNRRYGGYTAAKWGADD